MARLIKRHELKDFIGKEIIYQAYGLSFEEDEDQKITILSIDEEYVTYSDFTYDFFNCYGVDFRFWTEKPTKELWESPDELID